MSFFSFFRGAPPAPAVARVVDVVPDALSMRVTPLEIEARAIQAYVTDGLARVGQAEVALAVVRRAREPADALDGAIAMFFRTLHGLASEKRVVGIGGLTELGPSGFIEPRFRGLVYADGRWAPTVTQPGTLCAVVLDAAELAVAKSTSPHRVLARLGRDTKHFPFPPYWDRDRPSVAHRGDPTGSVHAKVPHVAVRGVSLLLIGERLELRLTAAAVERLQVALARVPVDAAFAFVAEPDPSADAWLVWEPGMSRPSAITPPGGMGERLTGFELVVLPGLESDEVRMSEDGFAAMLTRETWAALRASLLAGRAHEVKAGLTLSVVVANERQVSRVDGRSVGTSGELREYVPSTQPARAGQRVVLLSSEAELRAAVTVEALAQYVNELFETVAPLARAAIGIRVSLRPSARPAIVVGPEPSAQLQEAAERIAAPEVRGPLTFEIEIDPA